MASSVRVLEDEKVYLRPLEIEDTDVLYKSFNSDTEMRRFTGTQRVFTKIEIQNSFQNFSQDKTRVGFGIIRKEDDQLVGDIALNEMYSPSNRDANFRIAIFDTYVGHGYGTSATKLMLDYGFGILNLHRIELDVYSFNERAIHVYEKLGFKREGIKRDNWYYDHKYYSSVVMSILEDEYRELYQK